MKLGAKSLSFAKIQERILGVVKSILGELPESTQHSNLSIKIVFFQAEQLRLFVERTYSPPRCVKSIHSFLILAIDDLCVY